MLYGLYISAAGLRVNEFRQATQANNLANSRTVGFKPDRIRVEARPVEVSRSGDSASVRVPHLAALGGGVRARHTVTDFSAGQLESTGEALDIALETGARANGFLSVRPDVGGSAWTRDGRMTLDTSGRLLTRAGQLEVLDDAGKPIVLDPAAGAITIDADGNLIQGRRQVARLGLASFELTDRLTKLGEGLFVPGGSETPGPFRGRVVQGFVESSAVDPTRMLADMIQTQRAYEANANMIRYQDETLSRAVNDIARIA